MARLGFSSNEVWHDHAVDHFSRGPGRQNDSFLANLDSASAILFLSKEGSGEEGEQRGRQMLKRSPVNLYSTREREGWQENAKHISHKLMPHWVVHLCFLEQRNTSARYREMGSFAGTRILSTQRRVCLSERGSTDSFRTFLF